MRGGFVLGMAIVVAYSEMGLGLQPCANSNRLPGARSIVSSRPQERASERERVCMCVCVYMCECVSVCVCERGREREEK